MTDGQRAGSGPASLPQDCIIASPQGVERLLESIVAARSPATVYSAATRDGAQIRFLGIDTRRERLTFVPLSQDAAGAWLLQPRAVAFKTEHQRVPIEFTCGTPTEVSGAEGNAYAVRFPASIIRLQRRETFRLPNPSAMCHVKSTGAPQSVHWEVLDLSGGGIALAALSGCPALERDAFYPCTIQLPGVGTLDTGFKVLGVFESPSERRYGCQFVKLSDRDELLLQRYILEEQRMRRRK